MEKKRQQFGEDLKRQEKYYSTKPEEVTPKHPRKDLVRMKNVVIKKLVEEAYDNKLPFDTEQRSRKQIIDDAFEMLLQSQTRKESDHA